MKSDWRACWGVPLALGLLAPLSLDGCVSVGISRSRAPGSAPLTGSVEVGIYETAGDLRRNTPSPRKIVSELVRTDLRAEELIYRGTETVWRKSDLPPGRYRLTGIAAIDEGGREKSLANRDSERFRLRAGESVRAAIVLKKPPVGAILGVSAGVAAVIAALIALAVAGIAVGLDREPTVEPNRGHAARPDRVPPLHACPPQVL